MKSPKKFKKEMRKKNKELKNYQSSPDTSASSSIPMGMLPPFSCTFNFLRRFRGTTLSTIESSESLDSLFLFISFALSFLFLGGLHSTISSSSEKRGSRTDSSDFFFNRLKAVLGGESESMNDFSPDLSPEGRESGST